jgi:hypothetical protein
MVQNYGIYLDFLNAFLWKLDTDCGPGILLQLCNVHVLKGGNEFYGFVGFNDLF